MIYKKLSSNFDLPYDEILNSLTSIDKTVPNVIGKGPILDQGQCWQHYSYGLSFLRNWGRIDLINIILDNLKILRDSYNGKESSSIIDKFLNAKFNSVEGLVPIKLSGNVTPHCDSLRNYGITIGLTSGTHKTFVSNATTIDDFNSSENEYYIVNKGDVYISQIATFHSVIKFTTEEVIRYTISYSIR